MAERQGYRLTKSRRRDHRALDYGNYWLHNERNVEVLGGRRGVSLDAVEEFLTRNGDGPDVRQRRWKQSA
jgi:hypothetical protein